MQAIIDAIKEGRLQAEVCLVISNNSSSMALERARNEGIPCAHMSSKTHGELLDEAILDALRAAAADLIVLAGYMKKLSPAIVREYAGRILNIHPALLPKFGGEGMYGMRVHEAVIAAGETKSGATVHFVDEEFDRGEILLQREVPVYPTDTPETLAARVLEVEHQIYPEAIGRLISNG